MLRRRRDGQQENFEFSHALSPPRQFTLVFPASAGKISAMSESPFLPQPAVYFPLERGVYEVAPGLYPLGHDFGNGPLDEKVVQLDQEFALFAEAKRQARAEFLQKYYVKRELPPAAERAAIGFLLSRLPREWPQAFHLATEPNRVVLTCRLTSKRILFAPETDGFALLGVEPDGAPPFACALDALISQIPEDLAIVVRDPTVPSDRGAISGRDRLAFLHVCSPSHWAPEEKAGLDFRALHAPVPGFERLARAAGPLVEAMIQKGPFVRFVWSFVTDRRLNHHPEPPPNWELSAWRGRAFDASKPESEAPFYLRIERQVTWGLPAGRSPARR
jgi:hypothetical protein